MTQAEILTLARDLVAGGMHHEDASCVAVGRAHGITYCIECEDFDTSDPDREKAMGIEASELQKLLGPVKVGARKV